MYVSLMFIALSWLSQGHTMSCFKFGDSIMIVLLTSASNCLQAVEGVEMLAEFSG